MDANMAKYAKNHNRPAPRGFMELTSGATYHEDIYGISEIDSEKVEEYAFDLCNDSEDDEDGGDSGMNINETPYKRRVDSGPSTPSRGVIKKPKYKARLEVEAGNEDNPVDLTAENIIHTTDPSAWFKIAPRQNPSHSLRVDSKTPEQNTPENLEQAVKSPAGAIPEDLEVNRKAQAFSQEKSRQHQLPSSACFELVRKQRLAIREQIHAVCGKARKVKESSQRDAAAAQACLINDDDEGLLGSHEPYVLVIKSEAPSDYIDFTSLGTAKESSKITSTENAAALATKNWKCEEMSLTPGVAYVFIVADG